MMHYQQYQVGVEIYKERIAKFEREQRYRRAFQSTRKSPLAVWLGRQLVKLGQYLQRNEHETNSAALTKQRGTV